MIWLDVIGKLNLEYFSFLEEYFNNFYYLCFVNMIKEAPNG